MRRDEDRIQADIVKVLRLKGYPTFAIPNGGYRRKVEAARMKGMGVVAGVADLCVMVSHGRVVWLEIKTEKGRQTLEQQQFEALCKERGHVYKIVRRAAEAVLAVEAAVSVWEMLDKDWRKA